MRSRFIENQNAVDRSIQLLSASLPASHDRILNAIDTLWLEVLKIRQASSQAFLVFAILSRTQIEAEKSTEMLDTMLQGDAHDFIKQVATLEVEQVRPFVGEKLWLTFLAYRTFSMKIALKLFLGKKNRKYYYWDKDFFGKSENVIEEIVSIFSPDEVAEISKAPPSEILGIIQRKLENKIVTEINQLIFGYSLSQISLEQQRLITSLSDKADLTELLAERNLGKS
jgi:hypothetical protein